jgi:hypothetical protein
MIISHVSAQACAANTGGNGWPTPLKTNHTECMMIHGNRPGQKSTPTTAAETHKQPAKRTHSDSKSWLFLVERVSGFKQYKPARFATLCSGP